MKKILIIEDEEILLKVLVDRFTESGWQVTAADNGEVATASLKPGNSYNIILLDLLLPQKSGLSVLKTIRADERFRDTPVLVLSNLGDDEDIKKAMHLGATEYFIKTQHPISEILTQAEKYLAGK